MRHEFVVDLKPVREKPSPIPEIMRPRTRPVRRTLVLAHQIGEYIDSQQISDLKDFCQRVHITRPRATQILNLLSLSPRIQEQILLGADPNINKMSEMAVRPLLKEAAWSRQEDLWGGLLESAREEVEGEASAFQRNP